MLLGRDTGSLAGASTWACSTQRRTDSLPTPSCLATAWDAAVNDGYSCRCSLTRRTALARSSGSIFFGMVHILLDSNRSGIKPGALQPEAPDSRLRHIGLGRQHAGTRVLILVADLNVRVVNAETGRLIRELTLNPTSDYQPTGRPPGPPKQTPK